MSIGGVAAPRRLECWTKALAPQQRLLRRATGPGSGRIARNRSLSSSKADTCAPEARLPHLRAVVFVELSSCVEVVEVEVVNTFTCPYAGQPWKGTPADGMQKIRGPANFAEGGELMRNLRNTTEPDRLNPGSDRRCGTCTPRVGATVTPPGALTPNGETEFWVKALHL